MLQFAIFVFIYVIAWLLSVCSISVLDQFLFESGSVIGQKTHVTKQLDAKLKLNMTWSPWFSRALGTLVVLP